MIGELPAAHAENARLKTIAVDLHWMARRYADGRQYYATPLHNENTRALLALGVQPNATGEGTIWARDSGRRAYDGLTDDEAAQGRQPDWRHDDKERRVEEQTTLLAECQEVLRGARIDVLYQRSHSQTKISRLNAENTMRRIDSLLSRLPGEQSLLIERSPCWSSSGSSGIPPGEIRHIDIPMKLRLSRSREVGRPQPRLRVLHARALTVSQYRTVTTLH